MEEVAGSKSLEEIFMDTVMNQKIWILFKNDLANSIPFHQLFRSAKQGNGVKITFAALLLMGIFLLIYNTLTAKTLVSLGQTALIPAYMLSVSSIMMIFYHFYVQTALFLAVVILNSCPLIQSVKKKYLSASCFIYTSFIYWSACFLLYQYYLSGHLMMRHLHF